MLGIFPSKSLIRPSHQKYPASFSSLVSVLFSCEFSLQSPPRSLPAKQFNSTMSSSLITDRAEIKRVFDRFDKNGDGTISASEMGGVLRALGSETSQEEVEKMMMELDIDKDGVVNFDEFAEFCARKLDGEGGLKELSEAFDMYDQDKNGLISANELHLVLSRLGQHCTVQDCGKMIKTVDSDGDGNVSFDEFRKMMCGNQTS